jgi:hypothetical protein
MSLVSKTMAGLGIALLAATAYAQEITPAGSGSSASTNDGNVPANAVDNNMNTRWSGSGTGAWLQLNLGSVKAVGYVKVAFYKGNERTSSFDIMVSTNGSVWTNVLATGSFSSNGNSTAEQTFDFNDVNAQYVRYVGKGNSVNAWNSVSEISVFQGTVGGPGTPTPTPTATPRPTGGPTATPRPTSTPGGTWKRANLTNFESYPAPDSEECREFNGCMWAGQFAFVDGKKPESWVRDHNIAAVAQQDASKYKLKNLRLKMDTDEITVTVYDMCADSDCNGCCTHNRNEGGVNFLIDIEKYTMGRFHHGEGVVQWMCLDCP